MEKEFVPYELALRMKQLGFDEPCIAIYSNANPKTGYYTLKKYRLKLIKQASQKDKGVKAPLYQQAFRWFREKYFIHGEPLYKGGLTSQTAWYNYDIISTIDWDDSKVKNKQYKTYEEAELACLEKLIEIVEQKEK